MNQKYNDWQKKLARIFKENSINRRHYETNIASEPFLVPASYASPSPFPFSDSSRVWTTSPVHLDHFLPAHPFQQHQVPQKKAHSSWLNPKFWVQLCMLHLFFLFVFLFFFLRFSRSSCPRPPSCVSTRFFLLLPFLQLVSFRFEPL